MMINGGPRTARATAHLGLVAALTFGSAMTPQRAYAPTPDIANATLVEPYFRCLPTLEVDTSYHMPDVDSAKAYAQRLFTKRPSIDKHLLMGWIDLESSFKADTVSHAAAVGLGQLRNDAARGQGLRVASNDELSCLIEAYGGSTPKKVKDLVKYRASLLMEARETIPDPVLAAADQRFHFATNLEASIGHLEQHSTESDARRFEIYHTGETNVRSGRIGPHGRTYFAKITARSRQYTTD